MTQTAFAGRIGWTRARLNELIRGKRGSTAEAALDLAQALGTVGEGLDEPAGYIRSGPGHQAARKGGVSGITTYDYVLQFTTCPVALEMYPEQDSEDAVDEEAVTEEASEEAQSEPRRFAARPVRTRSG